MYFRKVFLFASILFLFGVAPAAFAEYQTEKIEIPPNVKDFAIGPGKQEIILKPGQSTTVEIVVSNRLGETRDFELNTEDFKGTNDLSNPIQLLGEEVGPFTLKNYIKYSEKTFTLDNATRARIPVTIKIPENAEPGGKYGTLLISTVESLGQVNVTPGSASGGVPINLRQGVLFFVRIEGDVVENGKLTDFKVSNGKTMFGNNQDVDFQLVFENKGSVHLNPKGSISITNSLGQIVSMIDLEPWFTMPDSLRAREKKWNTGDMMGFYNATAHIYRGFGALDDPNSYDDLTLSFWIVPWIKIGWAAAILILLLFVYSWIRKNFEFKRK